MNKHFVGVTKCCYGPAYTEETLPSNKEGIHLVDGLNITNELVIRGTQVDVYETKMCVFWDQCRLKNYKLSRSSIRLKSEPPGLQVGVGNTYTSVLRYQPPLLISHVQVLTCGIMTSVNPYWMTSAIRTDWLLVLKNYSRSVV